MNDETLNQILWFEALEELIEEGEYETAIETIQAAIALLRRGDKTCS